MKRVTVTLPDDVVEQIDRWESNRSRFVLQAARRELEERRREELTRSLRAPHPETGQVAEAGLEEWGGEAASGDEDLLDPSAGRRILWTPGRGWGVDAEEAE